MQTITTFQNPLADPLGTRRGPPLVRGLQFENRCCRLRLSDSADHCRTSHIAALRRRRHTTDFLLPVSRRARSREVSRDRLPARLLRCGLLQALSAATTSSDLFARWRWTPRCYLLPIARWRQLCRRRKYYYRSV